MNIFITGCAGYIGSVVTRYLLEHGHDIIGMDNLMYGGESLLGVLGHPRFTFHHYDILYLDETIAGIDAIVHLAAIVGEPAFEKHQGRAWSTGSKGTKNVINAADGRPVIFASTCSVYGQSDDIVDETCLPVPIGGYGQNKVYGEGIILEANGIALRFATAYGLSPRMRLDIMINELVKDVHRDGELVIYNPQARRPFVHVRDVAQAIEVCLLNLDEARGQIYNVGGENVTKQELALLVQSVWGRDAKVTYHYGDPKPRRSYAVEFGKIREWEFEPEFSLRDGIKEVIGAFRMGLFKDPMDDWKWRNA